MARSQTTSPSICEMREFAGFTPSEQRFITRALDVFMGRGDAFRDWAGESGGSAAIRTQYIAYRELRSLGTAIPAEGAIDTTLGNFMGALVKITAQDLAQEQIESFSAYRFLYERMLGAGVRPFLPAAFCGAAALPQIQPGRRKMLLQSLSEAAATAPAWSDRQPAFFPERITDDAA
ncbi:hypothetical protein [Altererythrobacter lauratis]|uniref:Uncharacterized protein n=1 Tax=Alteraurantiacibacter lauratis TaxID=2054627 RepID=A0ABV7EGL5_9SPHN